jgi:hypothetical protein
MIHSPSQSLKIDFCVRTSSIDFDVTLDTLLLTLAYLLARALE